MVPIVEQTAEGEFRDCLYFIPSQWEVLTDAQLAAMKLERVTNWIAFVQRAKEPQIEDEVLLDLQGEGLPESKP